MCSSHWQALQIASEFKRDLVMIPAEKFGQLLSGVRRLHHRLDVATTRVDFDNQDEFHIYGLQPFLALLMGAFATSAVPTECTLPWVRVQ